MVHHVVTQHDCRKTNSYLDWKKKISFSASYLNESENIFIIKGENSNLNVFRMESYRVKYTTVLA